MMKKVVIDTDAGVDDAVALIFAAKSEVLDIQFILAVGGNNNVNVCFKNVIRIFENSGLKMPLLVRGKNTDIGFTKRCHLKLIHGFDGLNWNFLPYS